MMIMTLIINVRERTFIQSYSKFKQESIRMTASFAFRNSGKHGGLRALPKIQLTTQRQQQTYTCRMIKVRNALLRPRHLVNANAIGQSNNSLGVLFTCKQGADKDISTTAAPCCLGWFLYTVSLVCCWWQLFPAFTRFRATSGHIYMYSCLTFTKCSSFTF